MEEDSIKDSSKTKFLDNSLSLEMGQKIDWNSSCIHVLYRKRRDKAQSGYLFRPG